ncbi:MAG TPA: serine/threonine-protein kinase [Ktedonobacteraceae bacterium]|nr:serine/threonine-protein kinase [Ktedonobacteraceae bacterium]
MTRYRFSHAPRKPKSPRALFLPPPVLNHRYKAGQEIGKGGQARVYRAWDMRLGTHVILKRALLKTRAEETLYTEAETLAGLHHPAIPAFVAYFEEGGFCYLVEALREGTTMKHLRYFALEHVLWIGERLCEVLGYLHRQLIIHRDIAPGNIVLEMETRSLSLLDFGLARREADANVGDALALKEDLRAGTPGYVAPEQWEQGVISSACDIYGLGMVLGCALTDCQPGVATAVSSFAELQEKSHAISTEEIQLLHLLDRMVLPHPMERPHLSEVQFLFSHLSRQILGTT